MIKYEKVLDELLVRQFNLCDKIANCKVCCVYDECIEAFGDKTPYFSFTEEEFVKKIKEELKLSWEEEL